MFGASLSWIKSENVFLKIQAGTGDNLLEEGVREEVIDYCLWSTFRPDCIDTDGELDMECLDAGMFLFKEYYDAKMSLEACYQQAFEKDYDGNDVVVLMEE